MKFQKAVIYGFGKWIDYTIDFSNHSMICILGANESGKSTLQQFLLFMLFGLPPKQRDFYRPKTSGTMGGRLTIYDIDDGQYTIERMDGLRNGAATCYLSDERELGEEWLQNKLKGMTGDLYQSIFSFSAMDLHDIKQMKDEDLGEILLGIGLTGSQKFYEIEKRLQNKMGELFKPFGKVPSMNKQLDLLDELRKKSLQYKKSEASYRYKQAEKYDLQKELNKLRNDLHEKKTKLLSIQKKQQSLPIIREFYQKKRQLRNFPSEISFPENGIERLRTLKEKSLPLQSELTILSDNQKKLEKMYNDTQKRSTDRHVIKHAESLLSQKQIYSENVRKLKNIEKNIRNITAGINASIEKHHLYLTARELEHISFPYHIENKWGQLKKDAEHLMVEKEQVYEERRVLKERRKYVLNELEEMENHLLQSDQLTLLKNKVSTFQEQRIMQQLKESHSRKLVKWKTAKKRRVSRMKRILLLSIVIAIGSGLIAKISSLPYLYVTAVFFFIIGFSQWIFGKLNIKQIEKLLVNEDISSTIDPISQREYEEAESFLQHHEENKNKIVSHHDLLKTIDIQLYHLKDKESRLNEREAYLIKQKEEQQKVYPFLKNIELRYWPDLLFVVKQLISLKEQKLKQESEYKKITEEVIVFEKKVEDFVENNAIKVSEQTCEGQLKAMEQLLENYRTTETLLKQYADEITHMEEKRKNVAKKLSIYEKEVLKLYQIASVNSEEDYYKAGKMYIEKEEITKALSNLETQLQSIFSSQEWRDVNEQIINDNDLEIKFVQANESIKELGTLIESSQQKLADVHATLDVMESSHTYSDTVHQLTVEQERLNKLAHEWSVFKVAKETLTNAMRSYRRKFLKKVMNKTEQYFDMITSGAYKKVIPPEDEKVFQVERKDGIRFKVNELSKGTIDQLYIALRLSMSEMMSSKHLLPFLIDDAFVHFDAIRVMSIARVLQEIASDQQVIIFTCKRDVAKSLEDAHIISLE